MINSIAQFDVRTTMRESKQVVVSKLLWIEWEWDVEMGNNKWTKNLCFTVVYKVGTHKKKTNEKKDGERKRNEHEHDKATPFDIRIL